MSASAIKSKVSGEIWDSYFKFCNLRNPWDKTVSWFHFVNRDVIRDLDESSLIDRFRLQLMSTDKIMRDFHIYSIKQRPVMDGYIRHSHLASDLKSISQKLGLSYAEPPHLKTSLNHSKLGYMDYYNTETKQKITDIYAPEIEYFGWKFEDINPKNI